MGKSVLIILLGYLVIFNILANNTNKTSLDAESELYDWYRKKAAKNMAESGVNFVISKIYNNATWRDTKSGISFGGGTITMGAVDDATYATNGIKAFAYSTFDNIQDSAIVHLTFQSSFPVGVRAGVTSNTIVQTSGNLTIDGRDHDLDGNVIPNSGTLGISTTATYTQRGNSHIGGTYEGSDYAPSKPGDEEIIEESAIWEGDFPDTPDKVMGGEDVGYTEGTLKSIAQSGYNGSQYVTDPNNLSFPLSGVTYVEMGWGQTWQAIDFGNSSGILVIHNSFTNSIIKNLNSGTFTGLIIADDIDKIHCDILGAVVVLTESPPSGNVIGNGNGSIKYCSEVISSVSSGMPGVKQSINIVGWIH